MVHGGQSVVLSTRSKWHFQLDMPCVAACGAQHGMPTRDVACGTWDTMHDTWVIVDDAQGLTHNAQGSVHGP